MTMRTIPMLGAVRQQPIATKMAAVRRRYLRQGMVLLLLGVLLAMFFVWVRVQMIQLGYEVSKLRRETEDLVELRNRLKVDVALLKEPERLAEIAQERFSMRLPQAHEMVFVEPAKDEAKAEGEVGWDAMPPTVP